MATILSDKDFKKLLGNVINDGDEGCIRPNSYILRLGSTGEFLNAGKEFKLGGKKKGIKVQPGHSVALTGYETIDFRRETVREVFPDNDLHGLISPTTDLSREGIVAPTTQVDAGYHGTLNWTISNTSSEERRFTYKEKIFRLTVFRLEEGETPDNLYIGDYQEQMGYVRSKRKGAPVGMKDSEWEDSILEGGPEQLLDNLIKSGYPWNALGERLKVIDDQWKTVTNEYSEIQESINKLTTEVDKLSSRHSEMIQSVRDTVRSTLKEETTSLQNKWLLNSGSLLVALIGLILSVTSNDIMLQFCKNSGSWIGLILVIVGIAVFILTSRKK